MGRATARTACLVLLGSLAAGCAAPDVDPSEIQRWMDARGAPVEGRVAAMSGIVGPDDRRPQDQGAVTTTFAAPVQVSGARLSCFGEDTLTFLVEVVRQEGGSAMTSSVEHDVACAAGAVTVDVAEPAAGAVGVSAYGAAHEGAWHAEILGD